MPVIVPEIVEPEGQMVQIGEDCVGGLVEFMLTKDHDVGEEVSN